MTSSIPRSFAALASLLVAAVCPNAAATDVALRPINAGGLIKPNVLIGWDNTTSMNWELIVPTKQGMLWWNSSTKSAWDASGKYYTDTGTSYGVLFPIFASSDAGGNYWDLDGSYGAALPPTKQFAAMWSKDYNPLYYDPSKVYTPWAPAHDGSSLRTYGDAAPTAALSNPGLATTVSRNLTVVQTPWTSGGYNMKAGMLVPAGAKKGTTTYATETTLTSDAFIVINYYWPTYWKKEACTVKADDETCAAAPDGATLRRVQIAAGTPEMQNFANWWSYYRNRLLMGAAATGKAFEYLTGVRVGVSRFNPTNAVTMYDADSTSDAGNLKRAAGFIYQSNIDSGTRTLDTLVFLGEQFRNNNSVIQYSCQRNNAFIVTDGYADRTPTASAPSYSTATYGGTWPFSNTPSNTIANAALSYYTGRNASGVQFIRPDLPTGNVKPLGSPADPAPDPSADLNPNLHVNTYAITLGVKGKIWPGITDAYKATPFTWPTPAIDTQETIDDLWHATINGRGLMFEASDAFETAARMVEAIEDMTRAKGGQAALVASNSDLSAGDGRVYAATYDGKGWAGDIKAYSIDKITGEIASSTTWSASQRLGSRTNPRVIATSDGTRGIAFTVDNLNAGKPADDKSLFSAAEVNYLRGDRTGEGTLLRKRTGLLGAVINAQPRVVDGVVYASTGEGFLHAFDAATGDELWAFAPAAVRDALKVTTQRTWAFRTLLDGSPQVANVDGKQLLLVGRGMAGAGVVALDVTDPKTITTDDELAKRWKWEFPTSQGITTAGLAMGRPLIVRTRKLGTVVLIAEGYNGASNDGSSRVHVLDPWTGTPKTTPLRIQSGTSGNPGLAHLSAMGERDGTVRYVYGGDEHGNVWRFDLEELSSTAIAKLVAPSGARQPITAPLDLARINGERVVTVGTGRLLGVADFVGLAQPQIQSFYAFKDNGTTIDAPRTQLVAKTLITDAGQIILSGPAFDWQTNLGWYFDLPSGQQAHTAPVIARGIVSFNANGMSTSNCGGKGATYYVDLKSGVKVVNESSITQPYDGITASGLIALAPAGSPGSQSSQIQICWQTSADKINCRKMGPPATLPSRKNAWRIIHR
ncbi:pilus assembly protein [Caldimonas sp. KR1-144]|uniref:pilus assembly protein n=1 Tax=Caldimonas sp. KR1-144 TaxID=3400911 RepID=UPI003C08FD9E